MEILLAGNQISLSAADVWLFRDLLGLYYKSTFFVMVLVLTKGNTTLVW